MNSTQQPVVSPILAIAAHQWLESRGPPVSDYRTFLTHLKKGAEQKRAQLSSTPFYAKRAKAQALESGDEMDYWQGLFMSRINSLYEPEASSNPAT